MTVDSLVLAAQPWNSNAELIADCARLGYLRDDDHILDPTYGRGVWWKVWRPEKLTTHHQPDDGIDFRALPHSDGTFDAVAFDPPYVCPGGRKTSSIKAMHGAYGMDGEDFRTPRELQDIIDAGVLEMRRVVKPRGIVLVKCKDYIWSGCLFAGTHFTLTGALDGGFELVDRLEHIGTPGPQSQTRQVHARRNLSTLFVFRSPRGGR